MKFEQITRLEVQKQFEQGEKDLVGFVYKEEPFSSDLFICRLYKPLLIRVENESAFLGWKLSVTPEGQILEMTSDFKQDPEVRIGVNTPFQLLSSSEKRDLAEFWEGFIERNHSLMASFGRKSFYCTEIVFQSDSFRSRIWGDLGGELILDLFIDYPSGSFKINKYVSQGEGY